MGDSLYFALAYISTMILTKSRTDQEAVCFEMSAASVRNIFLTARILQTTQLGVKIALEPGAKKRFQQDGLDCSTEYRARQSIVFYKRVLQYCIQRASFRRTGGTQHWWWIVCWPYSLPLLFNSSAFLADGVLCIGSTQLIALVPNQRIHRIADVSSCSLLLCFITLFRSLLQVWKKASFSIC